MSDPDAYAKHKLTLTQELIMETLAARHRLEEHIWPFDARLARALNGLAEKGLVSLMSGNVPHTTRASLTEEGKNVCLSLSYVPRKWSRGTFDGSAHADRVWAETPLYASMVRDWGRDPALLASARREADTEDTDEGGLRDDTSSRPGAGSTCTGTDSSAEPGA